MSDVLDTLLKQLPALAALVASTFLFIQNRESRLLEREDRKQERDVAEEREKREHELRVAELDAAERRDVAQSKSENELRERERYVSFLRLAQEISLTIRTQKVGQQRLKVSPEQTTAFAAAYEELMLVAPAAATAAITRVKTDLEWYMNQEASTSMPDTGAYDSLQATIDDCRAAIRSEVAPSRIVVRDRSRQG